MENKNVLKQNSNVYFVGEKEPMTINEINDSFAICTRPLHRWYDAEIIKYKVENGAYLSFSEAYRDLRKSLVYTILDFKNNVKGAHNSFSYGIKSKTIKKDAKEMMKALESNEIEISRRNSIELNIDLERTFNLEN